MVERMIPTSSRSWGLIKPPKTPLAGHKRDTG
jgi:hypothetical protein